MKIIDIRNKTKIISISAFDILLIASLSIFVYHNVNNNNKKRSKQIEIEKLLEELSLREKNHLKLRSNL